MLNLSSKKEAIFYLCGSGRGEQNIAEAFKEAKDKKVVIVFNFEIMLPSGAKPPPKSLFDRLNRPKIIKLHKLN
jgi:hypothetical protein